jgi:tRNA(fMet)-specific endonuclease VapC
LSVLLDTNACIAAFNGRPELVRERIDRHVAKGHAIAVSTVVIFELRYGIAKSEHKSRNTQRLDLFLGSSRILPFEADDARVAGQIRRDLERVGMPIGPYDYLIAAQAVRHQLTLITANVGEFSRIKGLRWENWAE